MSLCIVFTLLIINHFEKEISITQQMQTNDQDPELEKVYCPKASPRQVCYTVRQIVMSSLFMFRGSGKYQLPGQEAEQMCYQPVRSTPIIVH